MMQSKTMPIPYRRVLNERRQNSDASGDLDDYCSDDDRWWFIAAGQPSLGCALVAIGDAGKVSRCFLRPKGFGDNPKRDRDIFVTEGARMPPHFCGSGTRNP